MVSWSITVHSITRSTGVSPASGTIVGSWHPPPPAGYPGTSIHHANFGQPGFAQGHGQGIILIYRRMAQLKPSGPTDWFAPMISLAVVCCASFIDRSRKMRNQFERQRCLGFKLQPELVASAVCAGRSAIGRDSRNSGDDSDDLPAALSLA